MKTYEEVKGIVEVFTTEDTTISNLEEFLQEKIENDDDIPKVYTAEKHLFFIYADGLLEHIKDNDTDYWMDCPEDWEFEYDDNDIEILQEALDKIIFRHESNNTSYSASEQIDITDICNKLKKEGK